MRDNASRRRCAGGHRPVRVTVSPRNEHKAASLKAKFPDLITVASSNQEVLDESDVVFIGLLPDHAEEVRWSAGPRLHARPASASLTRRPLRRS